MNRSRACLVLLFALAAAPALAAEDGDPVVRFWEARRVLLSGDAASAGELFRAVFVASPQADIADDCLFWFGECCLRQKDREPEAVVALNRLIREYPDSRYVDEAARTLAFFRDRTSVPLLLARLAAGGPAAEDAARGLAEFGEEKGIEWLAAHGQPGAGPPPEEPSARLAAEVAALREQVRRLTAEVAEALEILKTLLAGKAGGKTEEK